MCRHKAPPDPTSIDVFQRYDAVKVGSADNPDVDRLEKRIVDHLVELMYKAKSDELIESSQWKAPQIGGYVKAAEARFTG